MDGKNELNQSDIQTRLMRRLEREKKARKEAERLLEEKSLALYQTNLELQNQTNNLEQTVLEATKELRSALQRAEIGAKVKTDFLANMSHEIRTPMNAILGMSHLALKTDLNDKQRNYIEKIKKSADGLLKIINDILDFSSIEAGNLDIEQREFNIIQLMNNALAQATLTPLPKGLEIIIEISPELTSNDTFTYLGDTTRINQVLTSLLDNAIKFTEQGQIKIRVDFNTSTNLLIFDVEDSGIGMTENQISTLFNAFSQVDTSTTRKYNGTGLGLAISRQLARLMHGDIEVSSVLGKGSHFRFTTQVQRKKTTKQTSNRLNDLVIHTHLDPKQTLFNQSNLVSQQHARELLAHNQQETRSGNSYTAHKFDEKHWQEILNKFKSLLTDFSASALDVFIEHKHYFEYFLATDLVQQIEDLLENFDYDKVLILLPETTS